MQTAELQKRSLNMIARLWNAPLDDTQGTDAALE